MNNNHSKGLYVKEIIAFLDEQNISYKLSANKNNYLEKPVDLYVFTGSYLAFYSGKDLNLLKNYTNPSEGLLICLSELEDLLGNGPFLFVSNPKMVFVLVASKMVEKQAPRIHPTVVLHPDAKIGKNVSIGALSVIGKVKIGDNTEIGSHVCITDDVIIGNSVIIMNGARIGDPGLGSITDNEENLILFPHFESVFIDDFAVIGSGVIIDRGVLKKTIISKHSHISTNAIIGHNSFIGENCFIGMGSIIGGSVVINNQCFIGFGSCIRDTITLAEGITVGMNSTVTTSFKEKNCTIINPISAKAIGNIFNAKI